MCKTRELEYVHIVPTEQCKVEALENDHVEDSVLKRVWLQYLALALVVLDLRIC